MVPCLMISKLNIPEFKGIVRVSLKHAGNLVIIEGLRNFEIVMPPPSSNFTESSLVSKFPE